MTREELEQVYLAGYAQAVKDYAIWRQGQQFVGVRQQPLPQVLEGLAFSAFVRASMNNFLDRFENNDSP